MKAKVKTPSNFTLHLIKVGQLKRSKKVSSDLKTILIADLADLRFSWAVNQAKFISSTGPLRPVVIDADLHVSSRSLF